MITQCPHCGHTLPQAITNGIASCSNCWRVFDSSSYHQLLSAAWVCRKHHVTYEDQLVYQYGYDREIAEFVIKWVVDECLTHEDFRKLLNEKGFAISYSASA